MDQKPPKDDEVKNGRLIAFPGGKSVDADEIGAGFVIAGVPSVPTPELIDPQDLDRENREREQYVKGQELVQIAERRGSTEEWIDVTLKEIAEEASHLKFERRKASKEGKNTANFVSLRVGALRQLTEVLLKRKEAALAERLDLKSPRFQAILKLWMEFVYTTMQKVGIDDQEIDLFFNQMKADMLEWEKKIIDID